MIFDGNYRRSDIRLKLLFSILISQLFVLIGTAQEVIVLDSEKNPIPNVSVFNGAKTKSALSNNEGIVNLSRFLNTELIYFQHPGYILMEIQKSEIENTMQLELSYELLDNIQLSEKKNYNNIKNTAEKKIFISKREILELGGSNTAELLEKKGGVSVQRSQMGGGSPNIRGFEANKVLLMIDGIRLNNAIYRSGHLQNIITIDEYMLDDIEVVFGPSSVIYGSDALGGTIHMKTKDLFFRPEKKWGGRILSNYNTAYSGLKSSISLTFESSVFGSTTNFSFKSFGDLKMGSWRPHGYDNWGLVYNYVEGDSIICNPNPEVQRGTGYSQYDFFNKMIFKIGEKTRITSNIQYSTSSNIPRFDKLNDGESICSIDSLGVCSSGEGLKFHSYYYGPQERLFGSLKLTSFETYFEKSEFILGYQKVNESRHKWYMEDFLDYMNSSEKGQYDPPTSQFESVGVYSFNANLRKNNFYFGSETIYNDVKSSANANDENIWGLGDTRYPPSGSSFFSTAYYISTLQRLSEKIQLEAGLRYTFSHIKGSFPDSLRRPLANIEGLDLSSKDNVLSGNIKLVYYPSDMWKISSVTSKGFHSPNIDDMLKVFKKGDNITLPNIYLKTEHSISQEVSITANLSEKITIYGVGFYTKLSDAIVKDSILVNIAPAGQEPQWARMIEYDDQLVYTFANQNSDRDISIYGATLGFNALIWGVKINGDFNITKGVQSMVNANPVAHIPPNFGKLEFVKDLEKLRFRLLYLHSGKKSAEDYDLAGIDNLDETPLAESGEGASSEIIWAGLPSWYTINFSVAYKIQNSSFIQLGVENILDAHYKTFGSGLSAPGRSLVFSMQYSF